MSSETDSSAEAQDLVQVAVDTDACIAGGQCEMLEPEVFRVDDDTAVVAIIGDPMMSRERAEIVVDRCPSSAISIVEAT